VSLSVDKAGMAYLDAKPVGPNELAVALAGLVKANDEVRVFISGDKDARHGDVIRVLDIVRGTGIQKVAFEIRVEGK
jgi:biopolymer transport protein ExbD